MANKYDIMPPSPHGTIDLTQVHHPIDALHWTNPEIGSLVYANHNKFVDPELHPVILGFRGFQSHEKIGGMRSIVKKFGLDSMERRHYRTEDRIERVHSIDQQGMTDREQIRADATIAGHNAQYKSAQAMADAYTAFAREQGLTGRQVAQCHLDAEKAKYWSERHIAEGEYNRDIHLSDNNLEALTLGIKARRETILGVEEIRADVLRGMSDNETEARMKELDLHYATELKKAEEIRIGQEILAQSQVNIARIQQDGQRELAYIAQEGANIRATMALQMKQLEEEGKIVVASYHLLGKLLDQGIPALTLVRKPFHFQAETPQGYVNARMFFEDGPRQI